MEKYKVLLVDDDEEIRSGVASFIKNCTLNLELVAQAENGADGLDLAEMLRPDIVLTDIKMPYMDGLTFCKKLRGILPAAKLVIFSGFDKFEYAQKAIEMNVSRYILKPINSEELQNVIIEVCTEIENERASQRDRAVLRRLYEKSLPVLRETLIVRMLDGRISQQEASASAQNYELELPKGCWALSLIKSTVQENEELTLVSIKSFIEKHIEFDENTIYYMVQYTNCIALLVYIGEKENVFKVTNEVTRICNLAKTYLDNPIISGIGRAHSDIYGMNKSCEEAQSALRYAILSEQKVVYIGDLEPKGNKIITLDDLTEKQLVSNIKIGNEQDVRATCKVLTSMLQTVSNDLMQSRLFFLELVTCLLRLVRTFSENPAKVFGDNFEGLVELTDFASLESAMDWYFECCMNLQLIVQTNRTDSNSHKVEQAKQYIEQNFRDPMLDVDAMCAHLHMSPAYFSTIFKKQTDMNFTAYVTNVRMEEAIKLLQNTDDKTYEIAEKIGYVDPNYFSYVFKKKYGVSPSKYKSTI